MDIVSNFIEHHQKKVLDMFREQKGITPHGNKGDLNVLNGEYRKLPKSEVLLMVFDSEQESRQITYEIKRNLFVGEDGLDEEVGVELYKLGEDVKMSGRFSNLF